MTAPDFTHRGYVVSITRRRLGNRLDSRRDFLFFSAYNPTTKHSIKGQGGKTKARQSIDNYKEPTE
jgi:hypothetical protein